MNNHYHLRRGAALSALLLGGALTAGVAHAAPGLSYSYVEGGYLHIDIDDVDADGDGLFVAGSVELTEQVFLVGGYSFADLDGGVDVDQLSVGIGGHYPLSSNLDLVGTLSYIRAEVDFGGGSADDSGYGLGVGLRGLLREEVELEGGISYADFGDGADDTSLFVGGRYFLNDAVALGAQVDFGDDANSIELSVRYEF